MTERRELLTINHAALICHVSRRTIYNWIQHGKVAWCRMPSGTKRIYTDSLIRPPEAPAP